MPNPLTGDYEACFQVAVRQINGLLAALHQNDALPDAVLKLLHSVAMRIGDPPPPSDVFFGVWLYHYYGGASRGRGLDDVRSELAGMAAPGAARLLEDAFADFDRGRAVEPSPGLSVVRGLAKVQVSTITISVPSGSSSEINLHANVRAHYYPDTGTAPLPAPIHGEMRAAFEVRKAPSSSGTRLLIQPSPDDSRIQFIAAPGSGLNAADQGKISAQVRKVLREEITLQPVDLPADFPFGDFKGLGSGSNQLIALPLQLSGAGLPASGVSSVTNSFIGSSGFAFAVSREHVTRLIDIEAIRREVENRKLEVTIGFLLVSIPVTFDLRFSDGPTLTFRSEGFEISGRINATGPGGLGGWVSFRVQLTLALDTLTQTVSLQPVGEPEVDESLLIPHDTALNAVRAVIDNALSANTGRVRAVFDDARNRLVRGLRTFDAASTVVYTGLDITPDGIVVRGDITSGARRAPVVNIAEIHGGKAFTAFESWIPAGRIDRFVWSWVEHSGLAGWGGTTSTFTDAHRFIFFRPEGSGEISRICLRIEGVQIAPDGRETSISATACEIPESEFAMDAPPWWAAVTLPMWRPNPAETTPLREAITGHVSVQSNGARKEPASRNTLVYFADWRAQKPLDALMAALGRVKSNAALTVIVVLPVGAFDKSRKEFEAGLPKDRERIGAKLQYTEDDDGGWTTMFGVTRTPSVYLMNARRQFVWKHEGEPDPAALAAALDQHPAPVPAPGFRPLRLAVSPGDSAPDASFTDDRQDRFALHRLRGRKVLLNFWQSWSPACLAELSRLQRLHQDGKATPFIVAFHGGKDGKALGGIRKRLKLSFPLVQDSQQRVASLYGVRCWPTTIAVGADGQVERVQFGTEHGHEHTPAPQQPKPVPSAP